MDMSYNNYRWLLCPAGLGFKPRCQPVRDSERWSG